MKKLFFFSVLALSAVLFASCNKEMTNPDEPAQEGRVVNFTINVGAPETKTYFEHDGVNNKYVPKWNNGDQIGVFFNSWVADASLATSFTNTAADGATATFTGTGTVNVDEQTIYAFYPASAFAKAFKDTVLGFTIPQTQTPTATSFDPAADILVNVPYDIVISAADVEINDMQFRRVGSILKIVLSDGTDGHILGEDNVKTLTLATNMTDGALTGRYRYDFGNERRYYKDGSYNEHMTIKNPDVRADLTANPIAINGSNAIYLIVNPCQLDNGSELTLTIGTNKHNITKTITLSKDITFPAGAMAELQISLKSTDTIAEFSTAPTGTGWYRVDNAAWLAAGDRVVIAAAGSAYALSTTQNTNNRAATAITKGTDGSYGTLETTDAVQVFVLEEGSVDDSFAFWNDNGTNANKYIYAASSSSNHLKTQATKNANASFVISVDGSGNATITAQGSYTHNLLKYNSASEIFSCYLSGQDNVAIYKYFGGSTPTCTTPVISLDGATVTITSTGGASIYYTTNGDTPTTSSTAYSAPFDIAGSCTVKAIAVRDHYNDSAVGSEDCVPTVKCATPVITGNGTSFEISCATDGATIFYETSTTSLENVATPSTSSSVYSSAVSITQTTYVKAYAVKAGCTDSDVASETCAYSSGSAPDPETITFSKLGLENGVQYPDPFDGGHFTITFAGGGNDGKYYNTGSGIRTYGDGTITIASEYKISEVAFTWSGDSNAPDSDVASPAGYSTSTKKWTGSSKSIVLTRPTGSGHWRLQSVKVTYE